MNSWELPGCGGGLERRSVTVGLQLEVRRGLARTKIRNSLRGWCMTCHTAELMLQLQCRNLSHLSYIGAALGRVYYSNILLPSGLCCFDLMFLFLGFALCLCLFMQDVFVIPSLQTTWHPKLILEKEVHFLN